MTGFLSASSGAFTYHPIDVASRAWAYGINAQGDVVGHYAFSSSVSHAFLFSNGRLQDLGTLGGANSGAYGVNNKGEVVGDAETSSGDYHAFLYDGVMHDLGTLGGHYSSARGINSFGQVVGYSFVTDRLARAFLYDAGGMHDLGTLGGPDSFAFGINDLGQVTGGANTATGLGVACLWSRGSISNLGTLGGKEGYGNCINHSGQVVGASWTADSFPYYHAFLYSGSTMVDLGLLPRNRNMEARGLNSAGFVVGEGEFTAFFYDGGLRDLFAMLDGTDGNWQEVRAEAINNNGLIAGGGRNLRDWRNGTAALLVPNNQAIRHPASYQLLRGRLVSGGLASLQARDQDYLCVQPVAGMDVNDPSIEIVVDGHVSLFPVSFFTSFAVAHSDASGLVQSIELWDWFAGRYVPADLEPQYLSDVYVDASAPSVSRFIQAGTGAVRAKVSYRATVALSNWQFNVYIDQLGWKDTPR